ncbi:hypothetical protein [Streptomyces sp. RPT161]|uniref:hypothetical protein n=1 Tax=Streptomyces sp. RPT161 TaxID=3015993 RepID=UPI0022B9347C|nr:hypothetical protein [Streptomyces sp. RPT161]
MGAETGTAVCAAVPLGTAGSEGWAECEGRCGTGFLMDADARGAAVAALAVAVGSAMVEDVVDCALSTRDGPVGSSSPGSTVAATPTRTSPPATPKTSLAVPPLRRAALRERERVAPRRRPGAGGSSSASAASSSGGSRTSYGCGCGIGGMRLWYRGCGPVRGAPTDGTCHVGGALWGVPHTGQAYASPRWLPHRSQ